jgi:hypothetical protein
MFESEEAEGSMPNAEEFTPLVPSEKMAWMRYQ